ncbi:hypothetical protein PIB30_071326 [Stylosanthes scabra]|uniref:Putative plant transposon protein domain-containing protein n=1 Tax=Stylosanthes scabra TaxID=79078 RepID=A0ABU6QNP9_9FABA|nr:hypothetical protein [Stylosanthes scabra]
MRTHPRFCGASLSASKELGWSFIYNDLVNINLTIVREFYSNFSHADQSTIYLRGRQIPITENAIHYFLGINEDPVSKEEDAYERKLTEKRAGRLNIDAVLSIATPGMRWDAYTPKSDRVDNGILTTNVRGWLKMIVCNLQPLRHETTFRMEIALLIYTLMSNRRIHLGRIVNKSMYQATSDAKDKRMAFPVMITKIVAAQGVPTYPEDQIITVPRKEKFYPFGDWQKEKKKARKDQPTTSSAAAAPPAPTEAPPCTNLLKKILKKLRQRKKHLRNTQYMIRTANPGMEFPDRIPVSSSDSDNEDYN